MNENSGVASSSSFEWTLFYEGFADKLLKFRDRRADLIASIHGIVEESPGLPIVSLQDRFQDGSRGPLQDICPFTVFGTFNRQISNENRKLIAQELASAINLNLQVPSSFDGIPLVNNRSSWFFAFSKDREAHAIDVLWEIFAQALSFYSSGDNPEARESFVQAYNSAARLRLVTWKLSMGLYWIRPRKFPTLDSRSRDFLESHGIAVAPTVKDRGEEYLTLLDTLEVGYSNPSLPVQSNQDLSYQAWFRTSPDPADLVLSYFVESILEDGCFLNREVIEETLNRLRDKRNLILQGPPGTGKTWLARRLAYALVGEKDDNKVRAVQFHPNLSYEDFVRGWRPTVDGALKLVDGPFIELIDKAKADPKNNHVLVVEEINRGNPAQIFGEMLTLLESDKRNPSEALELTYRHSDSERVYIPDNLYLIGTMNLADRSLALVDFALRRRFAFVTLEPMLGESWSSWVNEKSGIASNVLSTIGERINALNATLTDEPNLGPQFQIGHSFVTPSLGQKISDPRAWFRRIVETEIGPLLDEYWFDDRKKAQSAMERLLEGF